MGSHPSGDQVVVLRSQSMEQREWRVVVNESRRELELTFIIGIIIMKL